MNHTSPHPARQVIPAALAFVASLTLSLGADTPPPHVVMVSIDGLMPESYTKPNCAETPTLCKLAEEGAFARGVEGVFPTVTYPSHTTLITGVTPAVHGIYNNRILDPEDRSNGGWYWYAREIKAPTLPGVVRARGLRAASVNWPVTVGLETDFLFPEFFRSSHRETLWLLRALSHPSSLLDDVEAGRGDPLAFPLTDAERVAIASWIFKAHRPSLLLLHIFETDSAQHTHGPGTPEARAAIAAADRNLATLVRAIDDSGVRARTNVIVVSDHGFLRLETELRINTAFKKEGWIETDARGRITKWQAYFQASGGSGFVFLQNPADNALRARVEAVLAALAENPNHGIDRVMPERELRTLGADPRAMAAVTMKPGFYLGYPHDALVATSRSKGGHGFDPKLPALHAAFLAAGPNVPRTGDLGIVRMTQIAPTVASWFDVSLSPKADRALTLDPQ